MFAYACHHNSGLLVMILKSFRTLCPFLEHLDIPSNFFISLTDSIYYPPFQSLVGLEATTLPPIIGVFASITAGLYSCGSCVLSHKLRHPLQVVLRVLWWFRHHTGRSRPATGDPVFPTSQRCDTFRRPVRPLALSLRVRQRSWVLRVQHVSRNTL